ncbi:AAA family ATPase [Cellvibrio mixtus]|uniref:AAA family ATPase n=1 Tax=Cellvibrio mixtus TaxID=39650 RepID=UPI000AB0533C|nr:AAA family ATPase [Cellvibrio mixtus]
MTDESPLRAQPDNRILDQDSQQGYLFDELDEQKEDQLLADYRQRYGLSEDPFAHDYSFPLFTGAGRRQLLDQLLHLCQFSNSVLVVLGESGVGKTRVAHAFMDSLSDQDQICFIAVRNSHSLEQILLSINQAFGIHTGDIPSTETLLSALEAFIAEEAVSEDDGLAVVVLDNAHLLDDQSISVLTSLLNNFPQQNRLHLALFGEPSLMRRLERLSPENLLCNDFYLQAFTLLETVDYLNFRMEMADYLGPEIFSESKVDSWWHQAQGQLNVLHGLAEEHLLESVTPARTISKRALPVVHIVAISLLIAVVGVAFLYMEDDEPESAPPVAVNPVSAPAASVANSTAASATELTSTQTPVQPLMQSLPQPQQPNQQVQPQTAPIQPEPAPTGTTASEPVATPAIAQSGAANVATVETTASEIAKEQVVPLAQLPTAPPKQVSQPSSESAVVNTAKPERAPAQTATPVASTQAAATTIKPEPVAPPKPASKPTQQSGSAQERNILGWKPTEYTIQLVGVSNQKAALDFIASQPNKSELLMFKSKRAGKDWFVVITGRFANSAQARQAIKTLPSAQRDAGPWPRDIKTIQSEIKTAM